MEYELTLVKNWRHRQYQVIFRVPPDHRLWERSNYLITARSFEEAQERLRENLKLWGFVLTTSWSQPEPAFRQCTAQFKEKAA